MQLTILGCHSATPKDNTRPTSQVLELRGHLMMIDCGEGSQMAARKNAVKFSRIQHIFISHLHGDHFFGLIGLISTSCLLGREKPLTIYGPKGIKEIIQLQLEYSSAYLTFDLRFKELVGDKPVEVFEDEKLSVSTIPLDHRIYTNGYLFQEKTKQRKLDIDACEQYKIDKAYYRKIKMGSDAPDASGNLIDNDLLTFDPEPPSSYAFCSDTLYKEDIIPQIKGATVLYHESTFLDRHQKLCIKTKHSSAKDAARIAAKAGVEHLILGHYSTRYGDYQLFKEEAQTIFENTHLAMDGRVFNF